MEKIIEYLYDYDSRDQSYIIKLNPDRYVDIFNDLDHYPIRKRDISDNVITYIEDCSYDIDLKYKIKLEIKLARDQENKDLEERTKKGMYTHFRYMLELSKKKKRAVINRSLIFIVVFVVLALITFYIESAKLSINKALFRTIIEGFSIGSWVFLWEAIAGLVFTNKDNRIAIKTYKRLLNCRIQFIYR